MLKKRIYKYLLPLPLVMLSACGDYENTGANVVASGSSEFISAEPIDDINTSTMLQVVQANIDANATNAFGYKAVKIKYKTKGQNDEDINASGLLVIPTASEAYQSYRASQGEKPFSVSMLCDNHGTIFTNAEAPSNVEVTDGLPNYSLAVLMAGYAGFAAILPDYIGYGESNDKKHPYLLKKASARASEDMIKASIKYMEDEGVLLNYQLYISGYSQGGYTAMALAQKVEEGLSENVNLMGVAPMAGPHNLEAIGDIEMNATHTMVYPAFLAYLADAYANSYDDLNVSEMVVDSKESAFNGLFDGSKTNIEIHTALGLVTDARGGFNQHTANVLFEDDFINDYENNTNNDFRDKLNLNSVDNWVPKSKMNLIHCIDDEIIPFNISQTTFNDMNESGADVTLTPIPTAYLSQQQDAAHPFVHGNCGTEAYGAAITWFNAIRNGDI